MSSSLWRRIKIKKGLGGAGDVTEYEKDAIIEKAVAQWEKMGLTQNEMAFGIATMNVESGFNPDAKNPGPNSTAFGLGQFTDPTWRAAVEEYNEKYRSRSEPRIYPDVSRDAPGRPDKGNGRMDGRYGENIGRLPLTIS